MDVFGSNVTSLGIHVSGGKLRYGFSFDDVCLNLKRMVAEMLTKEQEVQFNSWMHETWGWGIDTDSAIIAERYEKWTEFSDEEMSDDEYATLMLENYMKNWLEMVAKGELVYPAETVEEIDIQEDRYSFDDLHPQRPIAYGGFAGQGIWGR